MTSHKEINCYVACHFLSDIKYSPLAEYIPRHSAAPQYQNKEDSNITQCTLNGCAW
jgi:hypothetical protein